MDFKEVVAIIYVTLFVMVVWLKCAGLPGLFEALLYVVDDEERYTFV
jgi:hypothetical protein